MNTPLDLSAFSALFPDFNDVVIISSDGEITRKDRGVAAEFTQQQRYLICHRKWSEARLQKELRAPNPEHDHIITWRRVGARKRAFRET